MCVRKHSDLNKLYLKRRFCPGLERLKAAITVPTFDLTVGKIHYYRLVLPQIAIWGRRRKSKARLPRALFGAVRQGLIFPAVIIAMATSTKSRLQRPVKSAAVVDIVDSAFAATVDDIAHGVVVDEVG